MQGLNNLIPDFYYLLKIAQDFHAGAQALHDQDDKLNSFELLASQSLENYLKLLFCLNALSEQRPADINSLVKELKLSSHDLCSIYQSLGDASKPSGITSCELVRNDFIFEYRFKFRLLNDEREHVSSFKDIRGIRFGTFEERYTNCFVSPLFQRESLSLLELMREFTEYKFQQQSGSLAKCGSIERT